MMKNKFFKLGTPAMVLVWGMLVVGCDNGSIGNKNNNDPKKITITGIPVGKKGKKASISITDGSASNVIAWGEEIISSTSVTVSLVANDKDGNQKKLMGNGSYKIALNIGNDMYLYTGGNALNGSNIEQIIKNLPKYNISSATSTINLYQFKVWP